MRVWESLEAEVFDFIAEFCTGGRSGCTCQTCTHDDDSILSFVGRVDQLYALITVPVPGRFDGF